METLTKEQYQSDVIIDGIKGYIGMMDPLNLDESSISSTYVKYVMENPESFNQQQLGYAISRIHELKGYLTTNVQQKFELREKLQNSCNQLKSQKSKTIILSLIVIGASGGLAYSGYRLAKSEKRSDRILGRLMSCASVITVAATGLVNL